MLDYRNITEGLLTSEQAIHCTNFSVAGRIFSKLLNIPLMEWGMIPRMPSGVFADASWPLAKFPVTA